MIIEMDYYGLGLLEKIERRDQHQLNVSSFTFFEVNLMLDEDYLPNYIRKGCSITNHYY